MTPRKWNYSKSAEQMNKSYVLTNHDRDHCGSIFPSKTNDHRTKQVTRVELFTPSHACTRIDKTEKLSSLRDNQAGLYAVEPSVFD